MASRAAALQIVLRRWISSQAPGIWSECSRKCSSTRETLASISIGNAQWSRRDAMMHSLTRPPRVHLQGQCHIQAVEEVKRYGGCSSWLLRGPEQQLHLERKHLRSIDMFVPVGKKHLQYTGGYYGVRFFPGTDQHTGVIGSPYVGTYSYVNASHIRSS